MEAGDNLMRRLVAVKRFTSMAYLCEAIFGGLSRYEIAVVLESKCRTTDVEIRVNELDLLFS